jgi:EAL domain-containing protein (putative c-di-GMP-specific phosphodiesterase class I)
LRLATIAEGIEEQDQLDPVLRPNCDYGQSHLFSRSVTPDKLAEPLTLTRSHRRSARTAMSDNAPDDLTPTE